MKVAFVTMQFPVASEAFAAVEIRALRRKQADIKVLTYRSPLPRAQAMLVERGLTELALDQGSPEKTLRGLLLVFLRPADSMFLFRALLSHCWYSPLQLLKGFALLPRSLTLLQELERLRPDVLHLFWGHYPSMLGMLVKKRLPETVISQFLGAYDLETRFPLSAVLARQANLLFTHARANLRAIAALGLETEAVRVSYRGIQIPDPPPDPEKTPFLFVVAERLVTQKRTAEALLIFSEVHRALPDASLRILGDGPEASNLKRLARDLGIGNRVAFTGHVPHHEVFRHLAEAEVVLTMSQSRSERLPNAIKEAMLHRCLCLAARSPGMDELIEDGGTGFLVAPGDVETAAGRLKEALSEPGAAARIGARAQTRIIEAFDVDRLAAERMALWSGALKTLSGKAP